MTQESNLLSPEEIEKIRSEVLAGCDWRTPTFEVQKRLMEATAKAYADSLPKTDEKMIETISDCLLNFDNLNCPTNQLELKCCTKPSEAAEKKECLDCWAKFINSLYSPRYQLKIQQAKQEERERIKHEIEKHRVYDLIDISGVTPYVPLGELQWWNNLWQALEKGE